MEAYAIQLDEIEDKTLLELLTQLKAQQEGTEEEEKNFVCKKMKVRTVYHIACTCKSWLGPKMENNWQITILPMFKKKKCHKCLFLQFILV